MNEQYNPKLISNAKKLRKEMTKEERHLWYDFLKQLPVTVHRQKVIGNYIVDFMIASEKIIIELDGAQHYETEHQLKDSLRDEALKNLGYTVLRYSNADIHFRFPAVCEDVLNHIQANYSCHTPHQSKSV